MIKRLFIVLALGAAFAACSPSGGASGSPDTIEPTPMVEGSDALPSESLDIESASPSP